MRIPSAKTDEHGSPVIQVFKASSIYRTKGGVGSVVRHPPRLQHHDDAQDQRAVRGLQLVDRPARRPDAHLPPDHVQSSPVRDYFPLFDVEVRNAPFYYIFDDEPVAGYDFVQLYNHTRGLDLSLKTGFPGRFSIVE